MPLAIEQLNVTDYDLVISSSHAVAKGILTRPGQTHISYVHTPLRYAWDMQHMYLKDAKFNFLKNFLAKIMLHRMRLWDQSSANRVDHFVANSHFIAKRIQKIYRRDATVIHPPVDLSIFIPGKQPKEDFYLAASRLVAYKKMALIAESFTQMPDKKLVIIGDGPEYPAIKKYARDNIQILGFQPTSVLADYLQRAKAYIFAAEEDFGIMPLEAQASGTPVIAFGKGGALETVRDVTQNHPTGVFFMKQTPTALQQAIQTFEKNIFLYSQDNCVQQAKTFAPDHFKKKFLDFVDTKMDANKTLAL